MRVLVVDVAAEYGGAVTILNQFLNEFDKDRDNRYIVALSKPVYADTDNIKYLNFKWIKKSFLHRLFFDYCYIRKLLKEYKPDRVLSLQNNAVYCGSIEQTVYFHNALFVSEKRYSYLESKSLWIYQTVIQHIVRLSLKKAKEIIVQAEWIKKALISKWSIDASRINVKSPYSELKLDISSYRSPNPNMFFPANYSLYKNYDLLMTAFIRVWEKYGVDCGLALHLLGEIDSLPQKYKETIENQKLPVYFYGRLTKEEMFDMYQSTSLVFPSLIETIGLPLIESASVGSYILVSDLEYAHNSLNGYSNCDFFNPEKEEELIVLLEKVLKD